MEDLKIAPAGKCPLCGGDVILGECSFCGYAVPDTEKLSAVYDLSPDNVVFGEDDEDGDSIPTIESPDAAALPTAKQVRDAARLKRKAQRAAEQKAGGALAVSPPNTVTAANPQNAGNTGTVSNAETVSNTETVSSTVFVPYTKPVYGEPEPSNASYVPNAVVKAVSDFVVRHWWKLLLVGILPSVGYGFAFFYFVINRDKDKDRKISELFFAGAVLLMTVLLQAVHWDPTGFDILIQALIKGFLSRGRHYY